MTDFPTYMRRYREDGGAYVLLSSDYGTEIGICAFGVFSQRLFL